MDCLFVIDYQNDFVDGALGFPGAEKLDALIAKRVREYGPGKVWFTRDTHFEDYLTTREGRHLPAPHCIKGSEGWQNYGETAKALEEVGAVGIDKLTFGMDIADPSILALLPETAERIELCGLVSNICVMTNAAILKTALPEATVTVNAALTASHDAEMNRKALDVLEGIQVNVINR